MRSGKIDLKVGDKLYSDSRYNGLSLTTVERLTKTTAVLSDGSKLDNPTYDHVRAKGHTGGYGGTYYRLETDDLNKQYQRQTALRKVAKIKWYDIPTDVINSVLEVVSTPINSTVK